MSLVKEQHPEPSICLRLDKYGIFPVVNSIPSKFNREKEKSILISGNGSNEMWAVSVCELVSCMGLSCLSFAQARAKHRRHVWPDMAGSTGPWKKHVPGPPRPNGCFGVIYRPLGGTWLTVFGVCCASNAFFLHVNLQHSHWTKAKEYCKGDHKQELTDVSSQ